jgi:Rrf2 family iron-sulfur cluster assembly transcriptional regulator
MKLSTRSRYGTRIVMELARNFGQNPVQVSQIAKVQNIPAKYLEQLVRILKQANLIESVRGAKGGHYLTKKPETITVGQLVRLFEGQTDLVLCVSAPDQCERSANCRVRKVWSDATKAMYATLDNVTIADLIRE